MLTAKSPAYPPEHTAGAAGAAAGRKRRLDDLPHDDSGAVYEGRGCGGDGAACGPQLELAGSLSGASAAAGDGEGREERLGVP